MGSMYLPPDSNPEAITGINPITEGRYHCMIVDVQQGTTKNGKPYDRLKLQILNGEQPDQEGKSLNQTLFYNEAENGMFVESDAHKKWAWAAGLLKPGVALDFRPAMLCGTQVIVNIVRQKDGKFSEVDERGYAVWPVGHRDVANVPLGKIEAPVDDYTYI